MQTFQSFAINSQLDICLDAVFQVGDWGFLHNIGSCRKQMKRRLFALWCHFLTMIAPGYFEVSSMKMLSLTPKVMCVMVIVMRAPLSL